MEQLTGQAIVRALTTIDSEVGGPALFRELDRVVGDEVTVPTALAELGSLGLVEGEDLPGPRGANGFVLRGLTPAARALLNQVRRTADPTPDPDPRPRALRSAARRGIGGSRGQGLAETGGALGDRSAGP